MARDPIEGLNRLNRALAAVSAVAQEVLALYYLAGGPVEPHRERAHSLFRAATLNGRAGAAVRFAGTKTTQFAEFRLARGWLAEAAKQGDIEARYWEVSRTGTVGQMTSNAGMRE